MGDLLVVAIVTLIVLFIQIGEMRLETGETTLSNSQSIKAWTLSPKTVFGSVLQQNDNSGFNQRVGFSPPQITTSPEIGVPGLA